MARNRLTNQQEFHLWKRQIDQADQRHRDYERDAEKADLEIERAETAADAIRDKAKTDAERAAAERVRFWAGEEKKLLTRSRTIRRGATVGITDDMWVTHPRAVVPTPLARQIGLPEGATPLVRLRPGGGMESADLAPMVVAQGAPQVVGGEWFEAWAEALTPLVEDLTFRYQILPRLRDDNWMSSLLENAGVTISMAHEEELGGAYDRYTRKVTTIEVPRLVSVRVERTGLVLTFAHQPGTSAKSWVGKLDSLKSAFSHAGMNADELVIADGHGGTVNLFFNNADPFQDMPKMGVAVYDSEHDRSLLGIDSRGHEVFVTWSNNSGMVVGGVPGSGKTAALLPIFAGMAGRAELHVFDGKALYDLDPLKKIARTYDNSADLAPLLDALNRIEKTAVARSRTLYQKTGVANFWDIPQSQREALGVFPIFVVLDESPRWLDVRGKTKEEAKICEAITARVRELVLKRRSAGVVVVLVAQKPDAKNTPTDLRDNCALKLAFKVSTPEQAVTILGQQDPESPSPQRISLSDRGRFVMETEGQGIVLAQAFYVPPVELDEYLANFSPVPDQAEVAARLVGEDDTPDEDFGDVQEPVEVPELTREQVLAEAIRMGLIPSHDSSSGLPDDPEGMRAGQQVEHRTNTPGEEFDASTTSATKTSTNDGWTI